MPPRKKPKAKTELATEQPIDQLIIHVRDKTVMLDEDLAVLYGVTTGNLNKAVARNFERFPEDFMFELSREEWLRLLFQSGRANLARGGRRTLPNVFTQEGIAMLSSVLRSERAVRINIEIMRAFVRLRQIFVRDEDLARRVAVAESQLEKHDKGLQKHEYLIASAIKQLDQLTVAPKTSKKPAIGFRPAVSDKKGPTASARKRARAK